MATPGATAGPRLRAALIERLRCRCDEIEEAVYARVNAIADPTEATDPSYAVGLRTAVAAAIGYGLETLEREDGFAAPIPIQLLAQARLAARNDISLDVVLRRYIAGFTLFGDFILEEAMGMGATSNSVKALLATQASVLDRLSAAVGEEHAREGRHHPATNERRRDELIERLLAGEHADPSALAYDFDVCHLGVVAAGPGADDAIRALAGRLDCRLLLIRRGDETAWAWLGARQLPGDVCSLLSDDCLGNVVFALGEPHDGMPGWRLTHRQALAALSVGLLREERIVLYRDVALLAAVLGNDLHTESLHQIFIAPLQQERKGGSVALATLRAYFSAGCNATSAAAALQISPQAIAKRLRNIEERLGYPIGNCSPALEVAVMMTDLRPPRPIWPAHSIV